MARYPKPDGYRGGPDGKILRQGTGGRLGVNPHDDDIDQSLQSDFSFRRQELDFDDAHLGCSDTSYRGIQDGEPAGMYDGDEIG